MNNYVRYRRWWMATVYMRSLQTETFDKAFGQHINSMTLYELMETLVDWEEEAAEPIQPPPFIPPTPPYKYDPQPYPQPWPAPFTPNIWPGVRNCSKCGINLHGVMGYVCNDAHCPTFMKVTC